MVKTDTRTRILINSLLLFNEHGEPNTTTNEIADEVDISPGNLHYHFRKKSDLVTALLAEFQADVRRALEPPAAEQASITDFWVFLHLLLEVLATYRFLLRDMETLVSAYPKVSHALKGFSKGLTAVMQLYVEALRRDGHLAIEDRDVPVVCRNLVVVALFSERYDEVSGAGSTADVSALKTATSMLGLISPYSTDEASPVLAELTEHYR